MVGALRKSLCLVLLAKVELDAATSTRAEFAKFVRAESEKWARVIKDANIRVQQWRTPRRHVMQPRPPRDRVVSAASSR